VLPRDRAGRCRLLRQGNRIAFIEHAEGRVSIDARRACVGEADRAARAAVGFRDRPTLLQRCLKVPVADGPI
jgi:hypothetical protein